MRVSPFTSSSRISRMSRSWSMSGALIFGVLVVAGTAGYAQERGNAEPAPPVASAARESIVPELSLVRATYDSIGGYLESYYVAYGRQWERWETDYPEAEQNFARRLGELTRVRLAREPLSLRLDDPTLLDHPFLYMSDVGWMKLSEEEVAGLRDYLLKGGFLWVDDFWGDAEWSNFERVMRSVLPDVPWKEIPVEHPLRHMAFDIATVPQIPARDFATAGFTTEPPDFHRSPAGNLEGAHLRGYFGADGELMVVATHNTDVGDGFEREAYGQWYFENFSTRAYALGVNIVLYAMTH